MTERLLIYVAGPYSPVFPKEIPEKEHALEAPRIILQNVNEAIQVGIQLIEKGHVAVIPHLTYFIHMASPKPLPKHFWYDFDYHMLERCDAILRFKPSPGADRELERMKKLGKLWWLSIDDVPEVDEE